MQRRRLIASGPALALVSLPAIPADAHAQPAPALEPLLRQRLRQEGVGLAAMRFAGSDAPEFGFAGRRSAVGDAAVDAQTRFEWGSITKVLTGLLLADCVVRGECRLDGALEAVLPDGLKLRDSAGEPIRWLDLATHRSGLPRLPPSLQAQDADPYAAFDSAMLWADVRAFKPTRPRGAVWEYCNFGMGLLGEALGRLTGLGYEAALRQRLLAPLGLPGVGLRLTGRAESAVAQGHDATQRPAPAWQFRALAAAGAAVGTAGELARLGQCVAGAVAHPLEAAMRLATQRHADGPDTRFGMGLAWLIAPLPDGRRWLNHDGGTAGFSSSLFIDPAARRGAGVLANAQVIVNDLARHLLDPALPLRDPAAEATARAAAEEAARRQAAERVALELPPAALATLVGRYALNGQFKLEVRARGARLFAQATGQGEFELFASAPRRFFARVAPIEIEFAGEAGPPASLLLLQAGQRLSFVREQPG
jgi:serine-type D-Ala-D-Ala carboxypeptidase/endopeptidase